MHPFLRSPIGLLAAALLVSLCSPGYSGDYYKWTDENGNIHFSDSMQNVPEKYRDKTKSNTFETDKPSPPKPYDNARPPKDPSTGQGGSEKPSERYEVPYTPYEGSAKRVIISTVFNGSVTAPLAIDTGAPGTLISVSLAKRIGLLDEDQGRLIIKTGGIGGTVPAIRSIIDTLQVGGAKSRFIPVTVTASISDAFEGLLGLDFVSNYSVTIDSRRKVVVFEELPSDPDHPGGHDKEWWTALFKEFSSSRAEWKAYREQLDKEIRDSLMTSVKSRDKVLQDYADYQYREAGKLLDKLDRYAKENAVPMNWRRY